MDLEAFSLSTFSLNFRMVTCMSILAAVIALVVKWRSANICITENNFSKVVAYRQYHYDASLN